MARFLVAKDVFLRELTRGSISEDLNRVDLLCFLQVNSLQLLPWKFQKCKKTNLNAYSALIAFWRLKAWCFSSHHFGDFSFFRFCLNLVLLSFFRFFLPCVWFLPRHLQKEGKRWDPENLLAPTATPASWKCSQGTSILPHGFAEMGVIPLLPPLALVTHWSRCCFSWTGITQSWLELHNKAKMWGSNSFPF